jgi:hypothetical protein
MIETAYSGDFLKAKYKKNRAKQRYYHSIANRILSQCHAIAPEKQGIGDWKSKILIFHEGKTSCSSETINQILVAFLYCLDS